MPRRRKPRKPTGRPCKVGDRAVLIALVAALARGWSLDNAARAAGIGHSTLYRWLSLGRAGDARFTALAALPSKRPRKRLRGRRRLWDLLFR
jgi:hypothetical protein